MRKKLILATLLVTLSACATQQAQEPVVRESPSVTYYKQKLEWLQRHGGDEAIGGWR